MISQESDEVLEDSSRRYICTSCDSVVRARWHEPGGFSVGCDCSTVPVVPQMGQAETPDRWRVEREPCCEGVDVSTLETVYGEVGQDYQCPDCGATYTWDGEMATAPTNSVESSSDSDSAELGIAQGYDSPTKR